MINVEERDEGVAGSEATRSSLDDEEVDRDKDAAISAGAGPARRVVTMGQQGALVELC